VEVHAFRAAGYLPEALMNFLALLGWSPGGGREKFTPAELVEAFSLDRLNKANAKFDRQKLLAFNTDAAAEADQARLVEGFKDYLDLNDTPIGADDGVLLAELVRVNAGFRTFADIVAKCGVLFVADDAFDYDPKAFKKVLTRAEGVGYAMLAEMRPRLAECEWTAEALEAMLEGVCLAKEVGMAKVAQPIRVAVAGRAVSPPIAETLLMLGKESTLARIDRCLAMRADRPD